MSQHILDAKLGDAPIRIQAGWDRPLQGFYAVVEWLGEDEGEAKHGGEMGYLFSNLGINYKGETHPDSFSVFVNELSRLGIELPQPMIKAIEQDGENNMGNFYKEWSVENPDLSQQQGIEITVPNVSILHLRQQRNKLLAWREHLEDGGDDAEAADVLINLLDTMLDIGEE